jgi:hypothetical protein
MSGLLGALPSFIWGFDFRINEVQRAATREAVASGASLTVAYLAMNAAAALIASFGLLQNSPAVIIGAMLIAMLYGPIVGFSLGLAEADLPLLGRSLVSEVAGAAWVWAIGYAVGAVSRPIPIGTEILSRTSPNILDLLRSNRNTLPSAGIGTGPSSVKPAMTKDRPIKSGCTTPRALPSNGTSRSKAKPTRTIQPMKPTSKSGKGLTCWKRFGVLVLFAISGMNNVDSARCAIQKAPGSQAGGFITASPVGWVVRQVLRTAFYFIPSAMTGFIVRVFPFRNRVSSKEAFEGLELGEGKPSRPVLRGPDGRKAVWLLGSQLPKSGILATLRLLFARLAGFERFYVNYLA